MKSTQLTTFVTKLNQYIENMTLAKLSLSNQRNKNTDLKMIIITLVELKEGMSLKFVYRYSTRDITKNHSFADAVEIIQKSMEHDFYNADMHSVDENIKLIISPTGKMKIKIKQVEKSTPLVFSHDRKKERLISTDQNIYLRELGIVNSKFELRHEMKDKYLQINRYIEILKPEIEALKITDQVSVADMGSGKGYLTFALYDYLIHSLKIKATVTGVEYREDLVNSCNDVARKSGFENLQFIKGTIENSQLPSSDILIALHACDTATDDAIYRGIRETTKLIVCAPCCHKQVRKDFQPTTPIDSILKHGILHERQAELITDGIRALLMEAWGYKTKVFEFISSEHTPKNLMITGRKITLRQNPDPEIMKQISDLKMQFGLGSVYLETLLQKLTFD
jgi:SAM-dependent methyltransferase